MGPEEVDDNLRALRSAIDRHLGDPIGTKRALLDAALVLLDGFLMNVSMIAEVAEIYGHAAKKSE